jgi:hypothetical protein
MINLTANVTFPNINRWQVLAFDVNTGRVTLRFWAPANTLPSPPWIDVQCVLSDAANQSTGAALNASPQHWDDKVIPVGPAAFGSGGVGAANALTNAQNAYRSAANHSAGLRAVEGAAMADGWVSAALGGT